MYPEIYKKWIIKHWFQNHLLIPLRIMKKIALQILRIKCFTYNVNLRPEMHVFSTTSVRKISFHDTEK